MLADDANSEFAYRRPDPLPQRWNRAAAYEMANEVIAPVPGSTSDWFDLTETAQLAALNQIRRIRDQRDVEGFVSTWGLLVSASGLSWPDGKTAVPEAGLSGEPIAWMLAHARTLQVLTDLVSGLQGESPRLSDTIGQFMYDPSGGRLSPGRMPRSARDSPRLVEVRVSAPLPAPAVFEDFGYVEDWPVSGEQLNVIAARLLEDLISEQLRSATTRFQWIDGRLEAEQGRTLLESMYAGIVKQASDRSRNGRCLECDRIFVRTDSRQKFCPKDLGPESLCAMRYRQKKHRANAVR